MPPAPSSMPVLCSMACQLIDDPQMDVHPLTRPIGRELILILAVIREDHLSRPYFPILSDLPGPRELNCPTAFQSDHRTVQGEALADQIEPCSSVATSASAILVRSCAPAKAFAHLP